MPWKPTLVSACFAVLASNATAETPADGHGRYAMSPVEGGFLRLDTETGSVAMCARKADSWACEPIADKTQIAADKAKLETENEALKDRVKSLEEALETGKAKPDAPTAKVQLPTEEEVDKALDYVERIFKKFRDRVQKYNSPGAPAQPGNGSGAL